MVIGIYPRKSVYRDNSDSVQVQVQMCQEYAGIVFKGKNLEFRIYDKDEGFSGKNMNRPGFQEMMADVKADILDAIIVYKLDRISRNVREFSEMYEIFQAHNVAFVSVKESFDTSTPMGRTVMYILAAFAQLERENTSERVGDNMRSLGAAGKWTGGLLPAGMSSVRKKIGDKEHSYLIVNENEIGNVKLLFRLMLDGYSITGVERYCRDHGIHSRYGKFLGSSQLYSILTNPVYCQNSMEAYEYFSDRGCHLPDASLFDGKHGLISYGKTRTLKDSQKRQSTDSWTIAVGIHDYVLTSAEWIGVQKRLGVNKMFHTTAKYDVGILKGVLRCRCGSRMDIRTHIKNGIRFSYYYCAAMAQKGKGHCNSKYVRIEKVEEAFLQELKKIRLNPNSIHIRIESDAGGPDMRSLQAELDSVEKSISNLTNALTQAMDSPAAAYIIAQIEKLDQQRRTLYSNLRAAQRRQVEAEACQDTEKIIYDNICYLLDNFDRISYSGKNELIRKTVKKCILDENNLHIIF